MNIFTDYVEGINSELVEVEIDGLLKDSSTDIIVVVVFLDRLDG